MPGPMSYPDGKPSFLKNRKRANGEVVMTGKTAKKRSKRRIVED